MMIAEHDNPSDFDRFARVSAAAMRALCEGRAMMAARAPMRVGVVGCGNISDIYLLNAPRFRDIVVTACADLNAEAAERQAERYAIEARSVEDLLKSDDVDIVLNLTIPEAHAEVSLQAIEAGKHVYSEKPLATAVADGEAIVAAAKAKGLRVGAAPDTVLGAGIQEARALIDAGAIGKPLTGLAAVMSHGMEHWHPNPGFFFRARRGPSLRHGSLLSVCARHAARSGRFRPGDGPDRLRGTHRDDARLSGAGAVDQGRDAHQRPCAARFCIRRARDVPGELGRLEARRSADRTAWPKGVASAARPELVRRRSSDRRAKTKIGGRSIPTTKPSEQKNWPKTGPKFANDRGLGLADMARAIVDRRPHRANGDVALHVLAVMAGILEAATAGRRTPISRDLRAAGVRSAKRTLKGYHVADLEQR